MAGGTRPTSRPTRKSASRARRLRGPAPDRQASQRTRAVAEAQAADAAANAHAVPADAPSAKATKAKKAKEPKVKKVSGLDAAAQVLKDKGEPMTCKDIVETMLAKGMWKTGGKTPSATIYSAMIREIDTKPGESRFTKTGRGLFTLAKSRA